MRKYWKSMEIFVNARLALYMGIATHRYCKVTKGQLWPVSLYNKGSFSVGA